MTSSAERAAGSWSMAARTSAAGPPAWLVGQVSEQRRAQVPLAEIGDHHDDRACPAFSGRRATCSAAHAAAPGGDPDQQPLLPGQPPGDGERVLVADGMISSTRSASSTGGTNPAPMPWIGCGPFAPPDSTGDAAGSTATNRDRRLALLDHLAPRR